MLKGVTVECRLLVCLLRLVQDPAHWQSPAVAHRHTCRRCGWVPQHVLVVIRQEGPRVKVYASSAGWQQLCSSSSSSGLNPHPQPGGTRRSNPERLSHHATSKPPCPLPTAIRGDACTHHKDAIPSAPGACQGAAAAQWEHSMVQPPIVHETLGPQAQTAPLAMHKDGRTHMQQTPHNRSHQSVHTNTHVLHTKLHAPPWSPPPGLPGACTLSAVRAEHTAWWLCIITP